MGQVGFNWVTPVLCVENVVKSMNHYEQVLGFDIAWSWSDETAFKKPDAPSFACVCRGDIGLFLCERG